MHINASLSAHSSAQSSSRTAATHVSGDGAFKSLIKQLSGCFSPCAGHSGQGSQQLSLSAAQALNQSFSSQVQPIKRPVAPPKAPSPRLSDTPMKQGLSSMIGRELQRLSDTGGLMFSGIGPASSMIGQALEKKDSNPLAACFSDDEFLAINLYTTALYRAVNRHLRYEHQRHDDVAPVVAALNKGLANLARDPACQIKTPLYRGIEKSMSDSEVTRLFNPDKPYVDRAFMSATTEKVIAEGMTADVMLRIQTTSAVDISRFSKHPGEKEALILPGTPFKVMSLEKKDLIWQVALKEIPSRSEEESP